jgi:hypothetical protein
VQRAERPVKAEIAIGASGDTQLTVARRR